MGHEAQCCGSTGAAARPLKQHPQPWLKLMAEAQAMGIGWAQGWWCFTTTGRVGRHGPALTSSRHRRCIHVESAGVVLECTKAEWVVDRSLPPAHLLCLYLPAGSPRALKLHS